MTHIILKFLIGIELLIIAMMDANHLVFARGVAEIIAGGAFWWWGIFSLARFVTRKPITSITTNGE